MRRRRRCEPGCLSVFTYWMGLVVFGGLGVVVGLWILEWAGVHDVVKDRIEQREATR